MTIHTKSGPIQGSQRSRYMGWLAGWVASGVWSGGDTLRSAYVVAHEQVQTCRGPHEARIIGEAMGRECMAMLGTLKEG